MKNVFTRICCLALALVMVLGLAACGSSGSGSSSGSASGSSGSSTGSSASPSATPTPEFTYAAEFQPLISNTQDYISVRKYTDDGIIFARYEVMGQREADRSPRYDGEFNIYGTFLYFMDKTGKETKIEAYAPMPLPESNPDRKEYTVSSDVSGACFTDDGFVTIEGLYETWQEGDGTAPLYSEEYWANQRYEIHYYIRWFDKQGHELSCAPIEVSQDSYLMAYNMKLDSKGNVLASDGQSLRAIAPDGTDAYRIPLDGYVDGLLALPNGRVAAVVYGDGQMLSLIDEENHKLEAGVPVNFDTYNAITGNDTYDFFYSSGAYFYGYKIGEEPVKLFSWLSCDVNGNNVSVVNVADDGTVTGLENTYSNKDQSFSFNLVTVRKVPYDSVPHKQSIRMAVMSMDYRVQDLIVAFNRKNDKFRIEVTDYSEYNNEKDGWDAGQTKLNTEVLSGNVPDIFCLNGLNYTQLAAKGVLEDLYPYLDADADMKRDDFFANVLRAMEVNGKLCQTVSGFYINSVIGASAVVGDEPGWTYEQFNEALASMPEGCTAFDQYTTRDGILNSCLALDMASFVDWNSGKVSFDSPAFIELLKFANSFPSDVDWENAGLDGDTTENRLAQGKQMLVQTSAYSLEDIFYNNYTQFLGGKITYVGYPTASGTGNMIGLAESGYAMSSKSPYKDEIWKFLRSFFTKDYQMDVYALPSRIDVFESKAKDAMTVQYEKDEEGHEKLNEQGEKIPIARSSVYNAETGETEEIYALTQEQVDQIRTLIETTTKVADFNTEILEIVSEQAAPYFAGQKSAEEVAKLVQSKANIYVNEQR